MINGAEVLSRADGTYRRSMRYVLFRCRSVTVLGSFFKTANERTCGQSFPLESTIMPFDGHVDRRKTTLITNRIPHERFQLRSSKIYSELLNAHG